MAVVQIITRELDGTETVTEVEASETSDPLTDMQAQLAAQQALIDELLAALGGGGNE